MDSGAEYQRRYLGELRLVLEEICCHLCMYEHIVRGGARVGSVRIRRDFDLGIPDAFADIRVQAPDASPYFVEVKYGYSRNKLLSGLRRKYGVDPPGAADATKLVLVVDTDSYQDWSSLEVEIERCIPDHLKLEVWNQKHVLSLLKDALGVQIDAISQSNILDVREAFTYAKGRLAFGEKWSNDTLQNALLWKFGPWTLKHLCDAGLEARSILPPARYRRVVAVHADLCSFSAFVRETRDGNVLRRCLTAFYSKARFTIVNTGGMLYQFVGDEVVGLYGLPMQTDDYPDRALDAARALIDIGNSVCRDWQRQIDRVQDATGVHVGMAIGDAQIVSQRAFGRAHLGAISDAMNLGSRLVAHASPGEIVISNSCYWSLSEGAQERFEEAEPIDARNIGRVKAWSMKTSGRGRSGS